MYTEFASTKDTNFEIEAGRLGYMVGYEGSKPDFKQFSTNMERVAYKHGIKCGQQDKANGLTNMYADKSIPEQIEEILAPIGEAQIVTNNRYMLSSTYTVYIGKSIIKGAESDIIRKVKMHLSDSQKLERDYQARKQEILCNLY